MISSWGKHVGPALRLGVLALFFLSPVSAQSLKDLPPPPPPNQLPSPKPTPPPEPPKDEEFDVVRVSSNLVMVPVSVVDTRGEPLLGLQPKDFHLEEQGRKQEIAELGNPDQVPLDIALVFDISSSVGAKGFYSFQQAAAASFVKQVMKPTDRAAVFAITDKPRMVEGLASAEVAAARIIALPPPSSPVPTAFYDTVSAAAQYLIANSPERRRRVVMVISDGDDNFSSLVKEASIAERRAIDGEETTARQLTTIQGLRSAQQTRAAEQVKKVVQQADAVFYAINPGGPSVRLNRISMRAQELMQSIADSTGGNAFVPAGEQNLERVFSAIAAELRGQYLLQYYSNNESGATQFRTIKVSIPGRPDLRVRARQGYYPKDK